MEKSATLNLRVNPVLKQDAEQILSRLGIPMSTAIDMFLNQVVLTGGIPFSVTLPKPPAEIDISQMSNGQFLVEIERSRKEQLEGKTHDVDEAFDLLKEKCFK